jgi:hypothetical protein
MHVYRELDPHQISSCRHNLYFCLKLKKKNCPIVMLDGIIMLLLLVLV